MPICWRAPFVSPARAGACLRLTRFPAQAGAQPKLSTRFPRAGGGPVQTKKAREARRFHFAGSPPTRGRRSVGADIADGFIRAQDRNYAPRRRRNKHGAHSEIEVGAHRRLPASEAALNPSNIHPPQYRGPSPYSPPVSPAQAGAQPKLSTRFPRAGGGPVQTKKAREARHFHFAGSPPTRGRRTSDAGNPDQGARLLPWRPRRFGLYGRRRRSFCGAFPGKFGGERGPGPKGRERGR